MARGWDVFDEKLINVGEERNQLLVWKFEEGISLQAVCSGQVRK